MPFPLATVQQPYAGFLMPSASCIIYYSHMHSAKNSYISSIFSEAPPWTDLHQIWHSGLSRWLLTVAVFGDRTRVIVHSVEGGVKFRHCPLSNTVAINTMALAQIGRCSWRAMCLRQLSFLLLAALRAAHSTRISVTQGAFLRFTRCTDWGKIWRGGVDRMSTTPRQILYQSVQRLGVRPQNWNFYQNFGI